MHEYWVTLYLIGEAKFEEAARRRQLLFSLLRNAKESKRTKERGREQPQGASKSSGKSASDGLSPPIPKAVEAASTA